MADPAVTDGPLLDADCVHGVPWYDCGACDAEQRRAFELEARQLVLDSIDDPGDALAVAAVFARVDWRRQHGVTG